MSDGRWCLGLSVENGRIEDRNGTRLRAALRSVVERYRPEVGLTPNQDLLLAGFRDDQRSGVEVALAELGVVLPERLSLLRRHAMACPALPTCGLALAEAERSLPSLIDRLETKLEALGLDGEKMTIRMTGCPNGCARPYVADIAFVGRTLGKYAVFVGGRSDGSRLNRLLADLVPEEELVATLVPLFERFRQERRSRESFGDFCCRVGLGSLRALVGVANREAQHG